MPEQLPTNESWLQSVAQLAPDSLRAAAGKPPTIDGLAGATRIRPVRRTPRAEPYGPSGTSTVVFIAVRSGPAQIRSAVMRALADARRAWLQSGTTPAVRKSRGSRINTGVEIITANAKLAKAVQQWASMPYPTELAGAINSAAKGRELVTLIWLGPSEKYAAVFEQR